MTDATDRPLHEVRRVSAEVGRGARPERALGPAGMLPGGDERLGDHERWGGDRGGGEERLGGGLRGARGLEQAAVVVAALLARGLDMVATIGEPLVGQRRVDHRHAVADAKVQQQGEPPCAVPCGHAAASLRSTGASAGGPSTGSRNQNVLPLP